MQRPYTPIHSQTHTIQITHTWMCRHEQGSMCGCIIYSYFYIKLDIYAVSYATGEESCQANYFLRVETQRDDWMTALWYLTLMGTPY